MAPRIARLFLAVPGAAMAVILATGCAAASSAALTARVGGCVEVQTLTYSGAPDAHPASARQCVPKAGLITAVSARAPRGSAAPVLRKIPTVGKLTFHVDGVVSLNCTATVIDGTAAANNEELIVTAAHCIEGTTGHIAYTTTNLVFSPMWHDGKNPFGTWTVKKVFLNSGWLTCSVRVIDCQTNPLYDYAVVVLNPKNGKGVGDLTGADGWSVNQPKTIPGVTIAGIPATSKGTLVTTTDTVTVAESGALFRRAATPGFTDGASGGPWFAHFNTATSRGMLIGETGGFEQGGPSGGSPSYSDYLTGSFAAVVKAAVSFAG